MDIGALVKRAWEAFTKSAVPLVVGMLIMVGIRFALGMVFSRLGVAGAILNFILGTLISAFFVGGVALMAGKAAAGVQPSIGDLFIGFKERQVEYLIVGVAIQIGALACGIGVLVTAFLFMFAPFFVADGTPGMDSVKRSYEIVMSDVGTYALLFVTLIGLGIAGLLACGVGILVAAPLGQIMVAMVYLDAKNRAAGTTAPV